MSQVKLVDLLPFKPVTLDTPLTDVYKNSMQIDVVSQEVKDCSVSVYQRLLHEAMQVANQVLVDIGGGKDNIDRVDYTVVAAKFKAILLVSESEVDANTEDGKRPTAWRQAKSDIYVALKAKHPLLKTPGIGQTALRKAKEKLVLAADAAEDARKNAAHNAEHGVTDVSTPEKKLEGDASVGGVQDKDKGAASATTGDGGIVFTNPALAALYERLGATLLELEATTGKNKREKTGFDVAMSTIEAATDTLDASLSKFNEAMAALAQKSA